MLLLFINRLPMKATANTLRDGQQPSPWQAAIDETPINGVLYGSDEYDVLIVGAGITGLTAGLLLQNAGKKVLIADASRPGFGTTGGTSAHINTFADTTYTEAERAFGKEGAQLFADAIREGYELINNNINSYGIDCDFELKPGYLYAENEDQVKQLEDIYQGAAAVGVAAEYVTEVPTPINYQKALLFPDQAQFHPVKYLQGLKQAFGQAGGELLTATMIDEVSKVDNGHVAKAGELSIRATDVIYATHIPPKITLFSFRCAPYRSYVIAVTLADQNYPDALIYDLEEPYHYFRTHMIGGEPLLLVGGNDHKTGHDDPEKAFADLEKYTREHYRVASVKYRWSSQYFIPVDGFPYIGQMPEASAGTYCATGYNGNGMMLGSVAAKVLSDLILTKESPYQKIFSPARIKPIDGFTEFVKENADVAYHFVADRLKIKETASLSSIPKDSGKIVEYEGEKLAAYRDEDGKLHTLSPVCTHAGCIVNWNQSERSWDCPCHGARFDIDGKVLTGPADRDLPQIFPE
jgi:glycine/D-amino acid oxidase-like deaminating enzyme/nitrite reductase/ring-hydroxylating ferredoxin subunit